MEHASVSKRGFSELLPTYSFILIIQYYYYFILSTSPRKLQEMALPVTDGHGKYIPTITVLITKFNIFLTVIYQMIKNVVDVTNASGISMKQYEEQLNGLRKENFHLKLRIYFLEEKLGSGSPPAVQVSHGQNTKQDKKPTILPVQNLR